MPRTIPLWRKVAAELTGLGIMLAGAVILSISGDFGGLPPVIVIITSAWIV